MIHLEAQFLFIFEPVKLKKQVIVFQNEIVGQHYDNSYRNFYSKQNKIRGKKKSAVQSNFKVKPGKFHFVSRSGTNPLCLKAQPSRLVVLPSKSSFPFLKGEFNLPISCL